MTTASKNHKKGLLITLSGALLLTFDTLLLRLIDGNQWTVMFWRSSFVFVGLAGWWIYRTLARKPVARLVEGYSGLAVGLLFGLANITFIIAVHNTSIANVVFMLALNTLFASLFSHLWLKEKVALQTWIAQAVCLLAVLLIVYDGLGHGTLTGDLMAIATALMLGLALTISRRSGADMSLTPATGALIAAIPAFFLAGSLHLEPGQWVWMSMNGIFVMTLASALLALAPKYISAAEVAMFYLLETVLAPLWVWLVLGEKASAASLTGGAIVLLTLAWHSWYKLRPACGQNGRPT